MKAFEETGEYPVSTQEEHLRVAVSHYDCDSVSAAAILSGSARKEAWPLLEEAVIAADHTGAENLIADVLQGLDEAMSLAQVKKDKGEIAEGPIEGKSFTYPFQALETILAGKNEAELSPAAQFALQKRRESRKLAHAFVDSAVKDPEGVVKNENGEVVGEMKVFPPGIYYIRIQDGEHEKREKIATELLSGILPNAIAIVEASPLKRDRSRWEVAVRAGMKGMTFPDFNFHNLPLAELANIGGRWNAGSSGRTGGQVSAEVAESIARYIALRSDQLTHKDIPFPYAMPEQVATLFEQLPPPQNELEQKIIENPFFQIGLCLGKKRSGHEEGELGNHVTFLLQTVEKLYKESPYYSVLRTLVLLHDAGKLGRSDEILKQIPDGASPVLTTIFTEQTYNFIKQFPLLPEEKSKYIQSHAQYSEKFAGSLGVDAHLRKHILYHDSGKKFFDEFEEKGTYNEQEFNRIFTQEGLDLKLFLMFNYVDNSQREANITFWLQREFLNKGLIKEEVIPVS